MELIVILIIMLSKFLFTNKCTSDFNTITCSFVCE